MSEQALAQSAETILSALAGKKIDPENEKTAQAEIHRILLAAGIASRREVRIGDAGILDFMLPENIAMEVKLRGSPTAIYRQCKKYCSDDHVRGLILATSKAMDLPVRIQGKPTWVIHLSKAWLA